jgi:DNA-directed RNA polymerase subunit RPC12/RpoP
MSNDTIFVIFFLVCLIVSLVVAWLNKRQNPTCSNILAGGPARFCRRCGEKYLPTSNKQRNYCPECLHARKNLWKEFELDKIETWWYWRELGGLGGLAPYIACAIVLWFFPNLVGLLIIGFTYFAVTFWHDTKDLHKKE